MLSIEVKDLTKRFNGLTAVDGINFSVEKGEIFAFLGPNGAGKSTTIKMMTTTLKPTAGSITIGGFNALKQRDKVRGTIGVIFQDYTLDSDLTAYENLYYHSVLYRVPKQDRRPRIEEMLECVGLLDRKDELVKNFSGGMRRRVEIARGLLHSPAILFLDEPTIGLDVQTRAFLWDHIKELNRRLGITVFFTTHNMDEAERIATKMAVIDKGRIMIQGTAEEIKKSTDASSLENAFLALTGYDIREEQGDAYVAFRHRRIGR